jgi:hypothetical protein
MAITVQIIASDTAENSQVIASGSVVHVITDQEREQFGITDALLKAAINTYFGQSPNDAYVKSPTPWNDLYATYGWPQVQTWLSVIDSKVIRITSEPVILGSQVFQNTSDTVATFNANITDQVSESVETNWSETYGFEVGQTISYGVEFSGVNIGGETSMSFSGQFGAGGSQSQDVTVSMGSGVSVDIPAHQSRTAQLSASRGTLQVEITYAVTLTGDIAVNYNPTYKNHHFWALPINEVMQARGIKTTYQMTETIEVGYYANGKIVLK